MHNIGDFNIVFSISDNNKKSGKAAHLSNTTNKHDIIDMHRTQQ